MSRWEIFLILIGVMLDIFVAMQCQGSLAEKVKVSHVFAMDLGIAAMEVLAVLAGYGISQLLAKLPMLPSESKLGKFLSFLIIAALGVRMVVKGVKHELVKQPMEKKFPLQGFFKLTLSSAFFTLVAGIAFGFLSIPMTFMLVGELILAVIATPTGFLIGHRFGYGTKSKIYYLAAVILFFGCIDILVHVFF